MRTWLLVVCAGVVASVASTAFAQDEGPAVANVAEFNLDTLTGPNVGEPTLPRPPAPSPIEITPEEEPAINTGAVHLSLGIDFTNAYFFRGLRQEDEGFLAQPWATVGFDIVNSDDWSLQAYVGTWNSLHTEETGAADTEDMIGMWYESDAYLGLTAATGAWELGAQYGWFTSPSSAFTTVEELQFSVAYDDSEAMGAWALSPSVVLVIETGDGTSDGRGKGAYLAGSVAPGFDCTSFEGLAFSFPVIVGVSASDYYEHSDGSDDFFGFASAGAKAEYALPGSGRYGAWSCYVACNVLFLGDLAKEINEDEGTAFVVAAGVSMEY
jgi:hypothetical protein